MELCQGVLKARIFNPTPDPAPLLGRGECEKAGIVRASLAQSLLFQSFLFPEWEGKEAGVSEL